jgi:hypothetical protein
LTAQEAQTAIANYEAAAHGTRNETSRSVSQADSLLAQFMDVDIDGSLAQRVREVIATNASRASTTPR